MRDGERVPTSPERRERPPQDHGGQGRGIGIGSPGFGGGAYFDEEEHVMGCTPERENSQHRTQTRTPITSRIPPEDNVPKGCSLQSTEPLRDWFCKGADMPSSAEYQAALCQLEEFSLEGVRFPAATVGVTQRGETLAIFERSYHTLPTNFKSRSPVCSSFVGWSETSSRSVPESG